MVAVINKEQLLVERLQTLDFKGRTSFFKKLAGGGFDPAALPIVPMPQGSALPVSFAQQRQWFLWQLEPGSNAYHVSFVLRLRGPLDITALRASFAALIERHASLRTVFALEDDTLHQHYLNSTAFSLAEESFTGTGQADDADLQRAVEAEVARPFDLMQGPLIRARLLHIAPGDSVLAVTVHHIVTDGWSMQLIADELLQIYYELAQGRQASLPDLPIQYADYAAWQRQWMASGEMERQLDYWKAQLGGEQPVLNLPVDRSAGAQRDYAGARLQLQINGALAADVRRLAKECETSLFVVLLAGFQALLSRYSGQQDIRVGVPIANRARRETQGLVGFFVNTQVLKADVDPQMTFNALVQQVKKTVQDAQAHQDLPFEQLVEALKPERSLSHTPLFQVMYNHQTQMTGDPQQLPGLNIERLSWEQHAAQFDLTLSTYEFAEGIAASLNYATALFEKTTVERLARHWGNLLRSIVDQPRQRIDELILLDTGEQQQIVQDWNRTEARYPSDQCVHELIEAQAALRPDVEALVFGEQSLSYAQLNQRANQLAHKLREQDVGPDVLVGIAVERSIEMVVGLLAILKAGGAYVPLDPEYPQDRLAYMFEDSGIQLLLTQSHLRAQLPIPDSIHSLDLDTLELDGYSTENLANFTQPAHLAYVIYTSGSTGKPKGAGNSHTALVNRLHWMQKAYGLDGSDTVLQKTPFSFDVSVWEFFWPLLTGARLAVAQPGDHRDPERLIDTINRYNVSTLHFVPSMLQAFMGAKQVEGCASLKRIVCSGEALPADLARQTLSYLPQAGLYNLYGPTEAAIDVTHWTCLADEGISVPIGQPIDNLKTHILSSGLLPVAQGITGELYLGGIGLARGYHQRPALTAERFIPDPIDTSEQGGGRLYRTGDLARYRENGVIDYAGRIDHQVKIRGLRIELGEIEARFNEHEQVREAVVLDIDGPSGKQLAAYLVADVTDDAQDALRQTLREHLKVTLPEFMVPTYLMFLDKLPLSPNGKLDRKALPKPDMSHFYKTYIAPRSNMEKRLTDVWRKYLDVPRVGMEDNFFELGGHSLLAVKVVFEMSDILGEAVRVHDLLMCQTLSALLEKKKGCSSVIGSPVVSLNQCNLQKIPLFCLPPSGGSSFPYYPLAFRLRNKRPVYGLMCRTYMENSWVDGSWREVVEDYTAYIKKTQPNGPYLLLGWSSGGALAQEIASLLEADGQTVAFLGLVDSTPATDVKREESRTEIELTDNDLNLTAIEREGLEWAIMVMNELGRDRVENQFSELKVSGLNGEEALDELFRWGAAHLRVDADMLAGKGRDLVVSEEQSVGRAIQQRYWMLIEQYHGCHYEVRPHCWWAGAHRTEYLNMMRESLGKCAKTGVFSDIVLHATHASIIKNPDLILQIENAVGGID